MRFVLTSILSLSMLNPVVLPADSPEYWMCLAEWSSVGVTYGGGRTESEAKADLEQNITNERVYHDGTVVIRKCWKDLYYTDPPPSQQTVPPPQPQRPQPLPSASDNFVQDGFY